MPEPSTALGPKAASLFRIAQRLQALAQAGLAYDPHPFDRDRYEELAQLAAEQFALLRNVSESDIRACFALEQGYPTPKVDVRGVVFRQRKILMVRERTDGKWALPGGWADVAYSPGEAAAKEVWEEASLKVRPEGLLMLQDKRFYPHPASIFCIYKAFIRCAELPETANQVPAPGSETLEAAFFGLEDLPPLSPQRITECQLRTCFEYLDNPNKPVHCD